MLAEVDRQAEIVQEQDRDRQVGSVVENLGREAVTTNIKAAKTKEEVDLEA